MPIRARGYRQAVTPSSDVVIALDVDGVLIDATRKGTSGWLEVVGPRFGLTREDMQPFFAGVFHEVILGRVDVEAALADHFTAISSDADPAAFLQGWLREDSHINEEVVVAAEAWARAGVPIVLATTQEHRRVDRLRALFGKRLALVDVLYSAELGVAKPDPEFFRIADERIGGKPVVFIDDALANVEAARTHGWTAIHYPAETNWRDLVEHHFRVHGSG
jgi:putative hydrolase of the HAD superfamily